MNYLLDKIHIVLSARFELFDLDLKTILALENEGYFIREEYMSSAMMSYAYNYVIEKSKQKEGTIYLGFRQITYKDVGDGLKHIAVEYNPQKIAFPVALRQFFFNNFCRYLSVKICDVAIDFPDLVLNDFRIITKKDIMLVGPCSNLTRYIGPNTDNYRIKVYDKSKERQRLGIEYPQTIRVEVSLKKPVFHEHFVMDKYDEEYIKGVRAAVGDISIPAKMPLLIDGLTEKYGKYDEALCYLLSNVDEQTRQGAFALMSKQARAKYRAYFLQGQFVPIDIDICQFHTQVSRQINQCISDVCAMVDYIV